MMITDTAKPFGNWFEALDLWSKVVNWAHFNTSEADLKQQIKALLILMWSQKDWLKKEYSYDAPRIEKFVNDSDHIKVIADLANSLKHRGLDRQSRSGVQETDFYGRITLGSGESRKMYYLELDNGSIVELFGVLRGAMDEYTALHKLLLGSNNNAHDPADAVYGK